MDSILEPLVIGVRFTKVGKVYHFDGAHLENVKKGDSVVVETSRGWQIGEVAQLVKKTLQMPEGGWKKVDRLATPRDLLMRQVWELREIDVVEAGRKRAAELRIRGIKVIGAEYSFDGARLSILYSTEGEEKIDLKSMRQDMQKQFSPAMVELRQIGPRDVAKLLGGMGACGLETRCCSQFLTEFSSISIRMAKEQGVSLTPTEITGMCGRLRCCLIYEYDTYAEARKGLPKRGKRIATPAGEGKVIDVQPIQGMIRVDIPEVGVREFTRDEIIAYTSPYMEEPPETEEEKKSNGDSTPTDPTTPRTEPPQSRAHPRPGGGRPGRRRRGNNP